MPRTSASAADAVERFFQLSLLGLVASGFLAVASSGFLDRPTIFLVCAGLLARALPGIRGSRFRFAGKGNQPDYALLYRLFRPRLLLSFPRTAGIDRSPGLLPRGDEDPNRPDQSRLCLYIRDRADGVGSGGNAFTEPELFRIFGGLPPVRDCCVHERGNPAVRCRRPDVWRGGIGFVSHRGSRS